MSAFANGDEVTAVFDECMEAGEFLEFKRVTNRHSNRADLHAFVLLDKLVPGTTDIVSGSDHDIIYLEVSPDDLAKVASKEDILTLVRCGVMWNSQYDCLTMYT